MTYHKKPKSLPDTVLLKGLKAKAKGRGGKAHFPALITARIGESAWIPCDTRTSAGKGLARRFRIAAANMKTHRGIKFATFAHTHSGEPGMAALRLADEKPKPKAKPRIGKGKV